MRRRSPCTAAMLREEKSRRGTATVTTTRHVAAWRTSRRRVLQTLLLTLETEKIGGAGSRRCYYLLKERIRGSSIAAQARSRCRGIERRNAACRPERETEGEGSRCSVLSFAPPRKGSPNTLLPLDEGDEDPLAVVLRCCRRGVLSSLLPMNVEGEMTGTEVRKLMVTRRVLQTLLLTLETEKIGGAGSHRYYYLLKKRIRGSSIAAQARSRCRGIERRNAACRPERETKGEGSRCSVLSFAPPRKGSPNTLLPLDEGDENPLAVVLRCCRRSVLSSLLPMNVEGEIDRNKEGDDAESRGKESPPSPTAATSKEEEEAGSGSCWTPSSSIVTSATIAIVARSEAHQEGRQEPLPSIAAGEESAACRLEDGDAGGPHRSWPVVDLREGGGESSSVLPPLSLLVSFREEGRQREGMELFSAAEN
nr:hypothetical protein Iba_chr01bCG4220 [Ipomoea batatas]